MVVMGTEFKEGGCVLEAFKLKEKNGGKGDIYFVSTIEGFPIGQTFYVPDKTKLDDFALNGIDNGYSTLPLKVRDVLKYGTLYG